MKINLIRSNSSQTFSKCLTKSDSLSKAKNISGILDAIKELNQAGFQFTFTIGGNGSREIIEKYRSQHQLENVITVLPPLSHHEVAAYMQRAHCFILFSDF